MTGRLVVIAGPSGVGKGTVVRRLRMLYPELWLSISATTRAPRPGERDGVEYHFISDEEFLLLERSGGMLETAEVFGLNRYGTMAAPVDEAVARGNIALLEIDLDGARQVKARRPEALTVFIAPPGFDELVRRLEGRGTETPESVAARLATAREELLAIDEFDAVVVNDSVEAAARELAEIIGLPSR
ncbi:MAG: guanylate kinase [Ruaniaceae bacterium]|nr:guanylate kinase [Ruaniaceae bacterium]